MNLSTMFLGFASTAAYIVATVLLSVPLLHAGKGAGAPRGAVAGWGALGAGLHAILLFRVAVTPAGLALGLFTTASLMGWVIVVLYLAAMSIRPIHNLGVLVLPLGVVSVVMAVFFPAPRPVISGPDFGIYTHAGISMLAYAVLALSAFQALLLAFQDRRLRERRPTGALRHLPALSTQELWLFQLVGLGFFLLSLSLASGFMFLDHMLAQHLVHKTVLSVVAWLVFGTLLWGRWRYGWRGSVAVRWCLGGFVMLALAYFGSRLVLEFMLHRQWSA